MFAVSRFAEDPKPPPGKDFLLQLKRRARKRVETESSKVGQPPQKRGKRNDGGEISQLVPQSMFEKKREPLRSRQKKMKVVPVWMKQVTSIGSEVKPLNLYRIHPLIRRALQDMGVVSAFPVQAAVWAKLLRSSGRVDLRRDIVVCAPTGSGKTLAYALPIVQDLLTRPNTRLRALIVLPTRDLAVQVKDVLDGLCQGTCVRVAVALGQQAFKAEQEAIVGDLRSPLLHQRCGYSIVDVLVCTPGRLVDHLKSTPGFTLQHVEYIVVDEADRLLRQDYQGWVGQVLRPKSTTHAPGNQLRKEACDGGGGGASDVSLVDPSNRCVRPPAPNLFGDRSHFEDARRPLKFLCSATITSDPAKLVPLGLLAPRFFRVTHTHTPTHSHTDTHAPADDHTGISEAPPAPGRQEMVQPVSPPPSGGGGGGPSDDDGQRVHSAKDGSAREQEVSGPVELSSKYAVPSTLEEIMIVCGGGEKPLVLLHLLTTVATSHVLVFTKSVEATHRLTRLLQILLPQCRSQGDNECSRFEDSAAVAEFSSRLRQEQRTNLLSSFSRGDVRVVVCSDAMARGIDIPAVHHVVNYDAPVYMKTYIHRAGRTARAGQKGTTYTLVRSEEAFHFKKMLRKASHPQMQKQSILESAYAEWIPTYLKALSELMLVLSRERGGLLDPACPLPSRARLTRTSQDKPAQPTDDGGSDRDSRSKFSGDASGSESDDTIKDDGAGDQSGSESDAESSTPSGSSDDDQHLEDVLAEQVLRNIRSLYR